MYFFIHKDHEANPDKFMQRSHFWE